MLSFLCVLLLNNPKAMRRAQNEVDEVLGHDSITVDHVSKLPYLTACLREALRLWPTAPGPRVAPISKKDEDYPMHVGKMRYSVPKDVIFQMNLIKVHRDAGIYGADAEEFKPERMLDENFNKLPPNAWKVSLTLL